MLEALGKPSSNVPFVMLRRIAETDAFKQIEEHIGSGPYIFGKDEFKPGRQGGVPAQPEVRAAQGAAFGHGRRQGRACRPGRVEPRPARCAGAVNALQKGEVDIIESMGFDQYEAAMADPSIQLPRYASIGLQYYARFNHLAKPFDNAQVRRAAIAAMPQEPFLRAQVGVKSLYHTCESMFICGTAYGSVAGSDVQAKGNLKSAQELLKASGYDGTAIVIMKPTDVPSITKLPDVGAQFLRQAGFKVDLQAMDWQTLVSRRAKKDAPEKGGWHMFISGIATHSTSESDCESADRHARRKKRLVRLGQRRKTG